jgi:hypothetical protein
MTISELIEKLKEYPQDLRVVVRGYEDGLNDVVGFKEMEIYLNYNTEFWEVEKHEEATPSTESYIHSDKYEKVPALQLRGG